MAGGLAGALGRKKLGFGCCFLLRLHAQAATGQNLTVLPWRDIKATALAEHPWFAREQGQAVLICPLPPQGGLPTLRGMARGAQEGVLETRALGEPCSWGLAA